MLIKRTCSNCRNWMPSADHTGFCRRLAVLARGAGFVLDLPAIFNFLGIHAPEYHHVITPKYFRCKHYQRRL